MRVLTGAALPLAPVADAAPRIEGTAIRVRVEEVDPAAERGKLSDPPGR